MEPFDADSPLVETSGTAVFYRPGLMLNLTPEREFSSCFLVKINAITGENTRYAAVITVHKDGKDSVHVGNDVLPSSAEWQEVAGSDYVSSSVDLFNFGVQKREVVIWHEAESKMAVYLLGRKGDAVFGNPGAVISKTPDFRGCVRVPSQLKVGEVAMGWRESVQFCRNHSLDLVSLSSDKLQTQIYTQILELKETDKDIKEVWIGLRRSSLTSLWYWLNEDAVTHTHTDWADGEPGLASEGQCVVMTTHKHTHAHFSWRDEECCKAFRPVCYRRPKFLR